MKKQTLQHPAWHIMSLLFVLPVFYFIISAWLNYALGVTTLWKPIEWIFEIPANKRIGLNINLLILFGPALSLVISMLQLVHWEIIPGRDSFDANFSIKKHSWSWLPLTLAAFCLAALFLYSIGENCGC